MITLTKWGIGLMLVTDKEILKAKILIVDDDSISIKILKNILSKAGYENIFSTQNSEKAVEFYKDIRPELLILDLNMPEVNGMEVMRQIKQLGMDDYLPILILTAENDTHKLKETLYSGAKDLLRKPCDPDEVMSRCKNLIEVRLMHNQIKTQNAILEEKVQIRTKELSETQRELTFRLSRAMAFRDTETGFHIVRMSSYAAEIAKTLSLSNLDCELILNASPLHDIGKIGIPDTILLKPAKLTIEERRTMESHTTIGGEILSNSKSKLLQLAREIAISHHERWDGMGYPYGLKGDNIPLAGRICCIADVFDALTSKRPYKEPWPVEATLEELKRGKGTNFDPQLVDVFLSIIPQILIIKQAYSDAD